MSDPGFSTLKEAYAPVAGLPSAVLVGVIITLGTITKKLYLEQKDAEIFSTQIIPVGGILPADCYHAAAIFRWPNGTEFSMTTQYVTRLQLKKLL